MITSKVKNDLYRALVKEWLNPNPEAKEPILIEERLPFSPHINVYIVWDAFKGMEESVRNEIIKDAFLYTHPLEERTLGAGAGYTFEEADSAGINYGLESEFVKKEAAASPAATPTEVSRTELKSVTVKVLADCKTDDEIMEAINDYEMENHPQEDLCIFALHEVSAEIVEGDVDAEGRKLLRVIVREVLPEEEMKALLFNLSNVPLIYNVRVELQDLTDTPPPAGLPEGIEVHTNKEAPDDRSTL